MKIKFKDVKRFGLQNFIQDIKSAVLALNNNECEEIVVNKDGDIPFLVMMKYGKLRRLIEDMVRAQIREIDDVVARAIPTVNMEQLNPAQKNLLKIRTKLRCFSNMSDADVMNVTKDVSFVQLQPKEMLFDQGEDGEEVFYILKGDVKVFAYNQEEENAQFRLLATLGEGSFLGEMAPMTKEARSARVLSGSEGAVLLAFEFQKEISADNQKQMFQLYKNFVALVSEKLVEANNKMTSRR